MNWPCFFFVLAAGLSGPVGFAQDAVPVPSATPAYSIKLTDGRTIAAVDVRRDGGTVMVSQPLSAVPGTQAVIGQVGYPVKTIKKIEFPEPPQLEQAHKLLDSGKVGEALEKITSVVDFAAKFSDIPGNRWAELALVKLNALTQAGKNAEAETLAERLIKSVSDPEAIFSARVQLAAGWVRNKQYNKALPIFNEVIQKSESGETLATAWLNKGNIFFANHDAEAALMAYLKVPVLYPGQTSLIPVALMGSAKAYQAMGDSADAVRAKQDIVNLYPDSPEAHTVKSETSQP